jgi:hypothetical protein
VPVFHLSFSASTRLDLGPPESQRVASCAGSIEGADHIGRDWPGIPPLVGLAVGDPTL